MKRRPLPSHKLGVARAPSTSSGQRQGTLRALLALLLLGLLLAAFAVPPFDKLGASPADAAGPPDGGGGPPPQVQGEKGPPGLEWSLVELVRQARARAAPLAPGAAAAAAETVEIEIEAAPGQAQAVAGLVQAAGGAIQATYRDQVQAVVPIAALEGLAASPQVNIVRRPLRPRPVVTSQGVSVIGANTWHTSGVTGQGVKVAIVDGGFEGYQDRIAGGDLPASVVAWPSPAGIQVGGRHGTAVAEIVYDVAPGAQLYLVRIDGSTQLGQAVDWLITQDVDIISHSMVWPTASNGTDVGIISDIVRDARDNGILWVNAAGNEAQQHWGGDWSDAGSGWLNFSPSGTDDTSTIYASGNSEIYLVLTWDDPWGTSANDYDLYLYKETDPSNSVAVSGNLQSSESYPSYPREWIRYSVPIGAEGNYGIKINRYSGASAKLSLFSLNHTPQYVVTAGSLLSPADSASALSAGAVRWSSPDTVEYFSSRGPTADGRKKPDLVAPDGVSTASPGYASFYGTSAAAPHASGAAALAAQLYPGMTPAQLQGFLEDRAVDLYAAGKDNESGWGRVNMGAVAPTSIQITPGAPSVQAGGQQQFTATALAGDGTPLTGFSFTWSMANSQAGSINASGLFTAGTSGGTYTDAIKATSQGVDGFATVTVVPASIRVTPEAVIVAGKATQQFTAEGRASDGTTPVSGLSFTWNVMDPQAGTISPAGLFTAGARAGSYSNVIKASALGVDGTATVVVVPASVTVTPSAPSVQAGATREFAAAGRASDGATLMTNVTFVWSLVDSQAGSITQGGLFTASARAGTYTNVINASTAGVDGSVNGFASATVVPASVQVTPETAAVVGGDTQVFNAAGKSITGATVTNLTFAWDVVDADAGSIAVNPTLTSEATFTASARVGSYDSAVRATAQGVTGLASVSVAPAGVRVTPETAIVQGDATQLFTADGLTVDMTTEMTNLIFAWELLDSSAGSLEMDPSDSSRATFTASSEVGAYSDVIKASAQGLDGFASVTIPRVDLSLAPPSVDMLAYDTVQLTVEVDATMTPVDEVGVFIDYDPAYLEVVSIQPGAGLSTVATSSIDNVTGNIDYVATGDSQDGAFTLATVTVRAIRAGADMSLSFSSVSPRKTYVKLAEVPVLHTVAGSQASAWEMPAADFQASPRQGPAPLTVQFTDASTGSPTAWLWDFGDGAGSDQQHPSHTYTQVGSYTVTLTASNPAASDTRTEPGYIMVSTLPVSFTGQPVKGEAPLTVQFADTSTGSPAGWLWDFGDGATSDQQHPTHVYASAGDYAVSLTVTWSEPPGFSDTYTAGNYIQVLPAGSVVELVARTSLTEYLPAKADVVRVNVNIDDFKDAATGQSTGVPAGVAAYDAMAVYTAGQVSVKAVQGVEPFGSVSSTIDDGPLGQAQFDSSQTQAQPQAPLPVARLVPVLTGGATDLATLALDSITLSDGNGASISQDPGVPLPSLNFQRGDANRDGQVTIADALVIAQYLAGLRPASTLGLLNAASAAHDGDAGDRITIVDALYIAQMRAGIRDATFELLTQ